MTKEQFNHQMERIAAIDWSITTTAPTQVMFCMRYIKSLEAENAKLKRQVEWHLFDIDNIGTYPPHSDMYLTLSIPERMEYRDIDNGETYDVLWFELYSEEYWHEHNVTHWAYLPAPPREDE